MILEGRLWKLVCRKGHYEDPRTWTVRPTEAVLKPCPRCRKTMRLRRTRVVRYTLPNTSHPRMLSQKGFTPHYNEGFGRRVEDAYDFKRLLKKNGCEIAPPDQKKNIPSDFK